MNIALILLVYSFMALTGAVMPRQSPPASQWTGGVWRRQGDVPPDLHPVAFYGADITASNGHFWIGKNTTTNCPSGIEDLNCTTFSGSQTVFTGTETTDGWRDSDDTLSLAVSVPGGQQVYIAPDGALSYTMPHSAAMPDGALTAGFRRQRSVAWGAPIILYFKGQQFFICSIDGSRTLYQIFVQQVNYNGTSCYNFDFRTYTYQSSASAYEYA